MNHHKSSKYYQYPLSCLLAFLVSFSAVSQVTIPTGGLPSSGGTLPGGLPSGNTQPGAGNPAGPKGNAPANTNQPGNNQSAPASADGNAADAGKGAANDGNAQNQSKTNNATTGELSPAEQAKADFLARIYGSSIFANKNFDPVPNLNIVTPLNYIVGPGDELNIYLYNYAEITYKRIVTKEGFISLPNAGMIYVAGRNIEEVRKILIAKLSRSVPGLLGTDGSTASTKLMVALGEARNVRVFVTGEVVNPASYEITSLATAFNVLYQAGGPNEIGTFRDIHVVRDGKVVGNLDIYDFLTNGKMEGNIRVQDNDNVIVGTYIKRVEVTGQVKRPGIYELKGEEKLSDLFRYAGGFSDRAYRARIKLQRNTSKERRILDVSEDRFSSFDLNSGDSLHVETILDRFENIVTIQGAVMRDGEYSLETSPTLKKLIENAQGLREDAFVGRVNVLRTNPDLTINSIPINLTDVINNVTPDLILTRLDQVIIPSKFDMAEVAYVTVEGEVNNTKFGENDGKFPYMSNMTLEDVLIQAGGLKESAYTSQVEVVRRRRDGIPGKANAPIAEVFHFDIGRDLSMNSKETRFVMLPYDQVIVRKSPNYQEQQFVFLEGEVLVPGKWAIVNKNDKISDVINRAGGLTELANPVDATLFRRTIVQPIDAPPVSAEEAQAIEMSVQKGVVTGDRDNVKEEKVGIELVKILKSPGSFDDLIIQEGDIIRIPKRLETVQVNGEVLYPTTVKYAKGMSFSDYISQSGGFTMKSLRKSSYIKYPNGAVDRTRRFMVFNVYPKVRAGSEIFVPMRGAPPLTAQQAIAQTSGLLGSVLSLVGLIFALTALNNK
jgi:protein involved in polysaccharide export with SLBB domain